LKVNSDVAGGKSGIATSIFEGRFGGIEEDRAVVLVYPE
jgi:hypothetical protein